VTNLFSDDFYQDSFSSLAVELTIEYLLPRAEIKLAIRHSNYVLYEFRI